MIIEFYERLRGYDKWVETQATIESSDVTKTPVKGRYGNVIDVKYGAGDILTWIDPSGEKQYADFNVDDQSPLYQLVGGESVTIRFDPEHPDRFYYRDLLKSRVNRAFRAACAAIFFLAVTFLGAWLKYTAHH